MAEEATGAGPSEARQPGPSRSETHPPEVVEAGREDGEDGELEEDEEEEEAVAEEESKYKYLYESDASSGSLGMDSWIRSFCAIVGHEFFAEVSEDFVEDDFNLTGLGPMIPHFKEALELILDLEPEQPLKLPTIPIIEQSAELLYGLIHARFILSRQGLQIMAQKYRFNHFGVCPRYLCSDTGLLPVGRHDMPGFETVRLYCPCCKDIYVPPNSRYLSIDGAYFGTSFPGMFLQTYPEIEQECERRRWSQFDLKIYGFKVAEISKSGARMRWLRQRPTLPDETRELMEGDAPTEGTPADHDSVMSISMNGE